MQKDVPPMRPRAVFDLPVWTPGSYRLRDFRDHVRDVRATAPAGAELAVTRLDADSWEVAHGRQEEITFAYRILLGENDRFMLRGDERRCLTYEGPQVYVLLRDHVARPCTVRFDLPNGWEVGSGLVRGADDRTFFAQDYDFLADCPVKLGVFQEWSFRAAGGARVDVVVDGPGEVEFDADPWVENIRRIVAVQGEMFGGFPFDRYAFLFTAQPGRGFGGGLEHLTSTAIGISAAQLRNSAATGLGTIAHEFFHTWNVKRLRPRALGPFDYQRQNRTTALWLMEGVTSYYTDVTLARAGLTEPERFWESMARQISGLESNPARHHVSSAAASWNVWEPAAADRRLSYYNSGLVLGLLLDLEIRARTANRRSLDDVMRALYEICRDRGRGFEPGEIASAVGWVAGADFRPWFDRYVDGTVVPPYGEILAHAGLVYEAERSARKTVRGLVRGRMSRVGERDPIWVDPDASGASAALGSGVVTAVDGAEVDGLDAVEAACEDDCDAQFATDCPPPNQNSLTCKLNCAVATNQLDGFCLSEYTSLVQCRADGGYDCVNDYPTPKATCAAENQTYGECTVDLGCKRLCQDQVDEGCAGGSWEACFDDCVAYKASLPEFCGLYHDGYSLCLSQLGIACEPGTADEEALCQSSLANVGDCIADETDDQCAGYCYIADNLECGGGNCEADCASRLADPTCGEQWRQLIDCELLHGDFMCGDDRLVGVEICDGNEAQYVACMGG